MNTTLHRRLKKLEEHHHDQITIRIDRDEVAFPEIEPVWVTAKTDPAYQEEPAGPGGTR